jgi:hypothetical protein
VTRAYRGYLAELERECRRTLTVISVIVLLLAAAHPLLLVLAVPTTILAWWNVYYDARNYLVDVLYGSPLLRRALRFDDYDPNLLDAMELQRLDSYRLDSSFRLRVSALENFWQSYEASCRIMGVSPVSGSGYLAWMLLPLATLVVGVLALTGVMDHWNYLGLPVWMFHLLAWLLGIGAATLCKYVLQLALVNAAWDAVVQLPAEEPEAEEGQPDLQARDEFFSWKLPADGGGPSRLARRNGAR